MSKEQSLFCPPSRSLISPCSPDPWGLVLCPTDAPCYAALPCTSRLGTSEVLRWYEMEKNRSFWWQKQTRISTGRRSCHFFGFLALERMTLYVASYSFFLRPFWLHLSKAKRSLEILRSGSERVSMRTHLKINNESIFNQPFVFFGSCFVERRARVKRIVIF